jgi:hypothetical protein
MPERTTTTRRHALIALGASASAIATMGARSRVRDQDGRAAEPRSDARAIDEDALASAAARAEIAELFGPVRPGARLARCRVREIHAVRLGAVAVRMETPAGRSFQLDVLRDEGAREGAVGRAPGLAIYVSNGGDGGKPTDEAQGLAAMALGRVLARRVREGARVPELLTLAERESRFPDGRFRTV